MGIVRLPEPRFEKLGAKCFAGIRRQYTSETAFRMSEQWAGFMQILQDIPGRMGKDAYGLIGGSDALGNVDYLTGIEVADFDEVPEGLGRMRISPQTYAVFVYPGHVSDINDFWMAIYRDWMPHCGLEMVQQPEFERYSPAFNPVSGKGGMEIWVPVVPDEAAAIAV